MILFCANLADGAPGDLDLSLGGTGKVKLGFGGGYAAAYSAAVQADGKLILAGSGNDHYPQQGGGFLLARFDTNNVLDTTFGDGGKVFTPFSTNVTQAVIRSVRMQSDGKIVAAGYVSFGTNRPNPTLTRYNSDGSLDSTFGADQTGIVFTDVGQGALVRAMEIQSDGRIVVAGHTEYPANAGEGALLLARYQTNGILDETFGNSGVNITTGVTGYTGAHGLTLQPDGKIVAVGIGIGPGDAGVDFAIYRYMTNGVLDPAFGSGTGKVFTRIGANTYDDDQNAANAVAIQQGDNTPQNPDKIVVAGYHRGSSDKSVFALARYNLDGSLDGTFGSAGVVTTPIANGSGSFDGDVATSLVVQGVASQPRKIVVAGLSTANGTRYFTLARFTVSGGFDSSFGTGGAGYSLISLGSKDDSGADALVRQSGSFVIGGYTGESESGHVFAAARFTSTGTVDSGFGTNGLLLADISDQQSQANALALQPDGKIVVAGKSSFLTNFNPQTQFTLARLNADGSVDPTFGSDGRVKTLIGSSDEAHAVAIQPDGKIVLAGSTAGSLALARYDAQGSLDDTFGNNGIVTATIGAGSSQGSALQLQKDGKILVGGYAADGSGSAHFALARFTTNGVIDGSFGSAGSVLTTIATLDEAFGIGVQSDGKVVLAGLAAFLNGSTLGANFATVRYNTNGTADFSYGTLGRAQANAGAGTVDVGYAMALQADGKIVVAGGAGLGGIPGPVGGNRALNSFVALARFNTNGTPDTSFGTQGTVIVPVGPFSDFATSLALQDDGKLVVAGASQNGLYQFFAQRLNIDGSVDSSFGDDGVTRVNFNSGADEIPYALAMDASGHFVLAGDAGGRFGIVRLLGDATITFISLHSALTATNSALISWPYPATGWDLQQSTALGANAVWVTPPQPINHDAVNNFIVITPPVGNVFYRLHHP